MRIFAVTVSLVFAQLTHAADLKMQFVWEGGLPELQRIENPFQLDCRDVDLNANRQFVDAETMGVRDVVVYVYPPRRDRAAWRRPQRNETVHVEVKDCRIHPHIVVAQAGDKIKVAQHADSVAHNLNFSFFNNLPFGGSIPSHSAFTRELRSPEPAPLPIACNIHPWEKAYLIVLDHNFVGISDKEGNLVVRGLPHGTEVPLRFFHERGRIESVRIDGKRRMLDHGRLAFAVSDPVTDLGEIVIDASSFARQD